MRSQEFELTQFGGRFPQQPYFPFYLGNGVDAVLVNIMGSGECNGEYMDGDMGVVYPYMRTVGWCKSDRRTHSNTTLVYGTMFPLLEFASLPTLEGDEIIPRDCRQYFDPEKAVLTTFIDQFDNVTLEPLQLRITTFLTSDHVFVEHCEILKAPKKGAGYVYYLSSPLHPYAHLYNPVIRMDRVEMRADESQSLLEYGFEFEKLRGAALSWFDVKASQSRIVEAKSSGGKLAKMHTSILKRGQSVTRYLAVIDNEDAADPAAEVARLFKKYRSRGYAKSRAEHEAGWKRYFATSRVEIPDPAVKYLHDVSRYLMRANHNPANGLQPVGNFPYLWQGVMFWDAVFCIEALLQSGNIQETCRTLDLLLSLMPFAKEWAQKFKALGARLEWTVTSRDFTDYGEPGVQVHNNSMWAHAVYLVYERTGDKALLRRYFPLMEEYLLFMADHYLTDEGDCIIVGRCSGPDESYVVQKINDTWTCAITLKALMEYREALTVLGRKSAIADLDGIIAKLSAGLDKNVDRSGVLQSFRGGALPHWGSLVFHLFPGHPALTATMEKLMENYDPEMDLYNFHGVTRYAEKAFPWATYWAARILALSGDRRARGIFENALKSVSYFGAIPERIYYHGEYYNDWCSTAHAVMLQAIHSMLACFDGRRLRILSGAGYKDAAFDGIHAGGGLVVSARVVKGKIARLDIDNRGTAERTIGLMVCGRKSPSLVLKPGVNRCVSGRG